MKSPAMTVQKPTKTQIIYFKFVANVHVSVKIFGS